MHSEHQERFQEFHMPRSADVRILGQIERVQGNRLEIFVNLCNGRDSSPMLEHLRVKGDTVRLERRLDHRSNWAIVAFSSIVVDHQMCND